MNMKSCILLVLFSWVGVEACRAGDSPRPTAAAAKQNLSARAAARNARAQQSEQQPLATGFRPRQGPTGLPLVANPGGEAEQGPLRGDECGGATWENGTYNGANALSSERGPLSWVISWTVDDVDLPKGMIEQAVWYSLDGYSNGNGDGQIVVVEADGGAPVDDSESEEAGELTRDDTGQVLFGLPLFLNSLTLEYQITAGTWFVGLRPVFDDFGRSYIATADLTGTQSYFKSEFFGYPEWTPWGEIVDLECNVAFCLFVNTSGKPTGACCINGDCRRTTKADCSSVGGRYLGDGTSCVPNKCPGAAGACCLDTGQCVLLKPAGCAAQGGDFQGVGTRCRAGLCPIPDPCGDGLYRNFDFDGINGLWNIWTEDGSEYQDGEGADDLFLSLSSNTITGLHWYQVDESTFAYTERASFAVYATDGANYAPGTTLVEVHDQPAYRLATGDVLFGLNVYQHHLRDLNISLPAGTYYLSMRPQQPEYVGAAYWLSAPGVRRPAYWRGASFGYPDFVRVEVANEGLQFDFAFCVSGVSTGKATGACCQSGDCAQLTAEQCASAGGTYQGSSTTCVPNSCAGAAGACCLEDASCQFVKPDECAAIGGDFQGPSSECLPAICPLPDVCGDALFGNLAYDGFNGLSSEDASYSGWVVSWTADDLIVDERAELSAFYWFTLDTSALVPNAADYAIWYSQPDCGGPNQQDSPLHAGDGVSLALRISDDSRLFGLRVYLNGIETVQPHTLVPGHYFLGLRLQSDTATDRSFWATTGLSNCGAFFQSEFFGVAKFANWSRQLGVETDAAFCVVGRFGGALLGACCTGDACELLTQGDCAGRSGQFGGVDSPCFPNPCPNAPGACCLENGQCRVETASACSGIGGEFRGGDVECRPGLCPIPDPCDGRDGDALHQNSAYDGADGYTSQNSELIDWIVSWTADDVEFLETVEIQGFAWYTLDSPNGFETDGSADFLVTGDSDNCLPGVALYPGTIEYARLVTGDTLFGLDLVQNRIASESGLSLVLEAGTYWVGLRPVVISFSQTFWATAPLTNCDAAIRSSYFGYPVWASWSQLSGGESDVAFCVTGRVLSGRYGACCLDLGVCRIRSPQECQAEGGEYRGDQTTCTPNLCPDAPGACCFADGGCEFLAASVCAARGGSFQGADVRCRRWICPIPDPCATSENIYNNSAYDSVDGLVSQRSDDIGSDSITAEDITLDVATTLARIIFYAAEDREYSASGADAYFAPTRDCRPDEGQEQWARDLAFTRTDSGDFVFGRPVRQYVVETDVSLAAGAWHVGARPVSNPPSGASYTLTAPQVGCPGVWRAPEFGQYSFISIPDYLGIAADFAYCMNAESGAPCTGVRCGDSNGDGSIDFDDIDCFVQALIGPDNWLGCGTSLPGDAFVCANDANRDDSVDFDDIDGFVAALIAGDCD